MASFTATNNTWTVNCKPGYDLDATDLTNLISGQYAGDNRGPNGQEPSAYDAVGLNADGSFNVSTNNPGDQSFNAYVNPGTVYNYGTNCWEV